MTQGPEADGEGDDGYHYVFENRVRFAETDAQAVVFYGEYVTYQDESFNAFLRTIGYPYDELEAQGWDVHVVNVELNYRSPARFEDELENGVRVDSIGTSSIQFAYRCRQADSHEVVADGHMTHVAVDMDTGTPIRIPDAFREAVVAFQDVPPDTY